MFDDIFGLFHLNEEGALSLLKFVRCSDPGEDAVDDFAGVVFCGHEAARLCEDDNEAGGSEESGFAAHVGSGQQHDLGVEIDVVGDYIEGRETRVFGVGDREA